MTFHEAIKKALQHLELAERFLAEGNELIDKDSVQATEKLYKATEEAVKTIAIALKPPEADEAAKRGRWTTGLLESAVVNIMRRLELDELYHWWGSAYRLCVDGFHEARFRSIDVILRLRDVEAVVNLAKKVLKMCSA